MTIRTSWRLEIVGRLYRWLEQPAQASEYFRRAADHVERHVNAAGKGTSRTSGARAACCSWPVTRGHAMGRGSRRRLVVVPARGAAKATLRPGRVLEIEGEPPHYPVSLYEDNAPLGRLAPVSGYSSAALTGSLLPPEAEPVSRR